MVSTDRLTWVPEKGQLVAEMSDLGPFGMDVDGVRVLSHLTGSVVHFVQSGVLRDAEGEVQATVFTPSAASIRIHPGCSGTTLILLND